VKVKTGQPWKKNTLTLIQLCNGNVRFVIMFGVLITIIPEKDPVVPVVEKEKYVTLPRMSNV
jgi:hypothetical protein